MKKYIGGYAILDLASTTIYADALGALAQDKPVLVYDLPDVHFADTIKATTIDDDDVVQITKGGKTITIANDNTITNVGDIQNHLYLMNLYDSDGVISILVKKPLNDYTIDEVNNLSDDDKAFLKSLKDISIDLIGSMSGSNSNGDGYHYATFNEGTLYIKSANHNGYFNIENGTYSDDNDSDSLEFTFTKLI